MAEQTRLIKKYPNRRLYDTRTSSYITLADVKELVLKNEEFQVVDAKSSEDLTRSILLQIILEEETGGMPMFTSDLLSQMIRFYGNAMQGMLWAQFLNFQGPAMQGMMGAYMEQSKNMFMQMQEQIESQTRNMFSGFQFPNFAAPAGKPGEKKEAAEEPAPEKK